MEKQIYFKVVRRIATVLLVLVLLVACSAQVHAENSAAPDSDALAAMTASTVQEAGLTEKNFSAVAVQLEAVARADGRTSADRMLYTAFSSAAALNVTETAAVSAESPVNVITVSEKKQAPTFGQLLPFVIVAAAGGVLFFAAMNRKAARGTVYKPMRTGAAQRNPYAGYGMVRTYR